MSDAAFEDPRLAPLYDLFDDERSDLDVYLVIARELGARCVLDVGCGTATMTGNVAQAIADSADWHGALDGVRAALRPGGFLVFETRDPARRAWEEWTPERTRRTVELADGTTVERWMEVDAVRPPLVTFTATFAFSDGEVLTSQSTLRFRERSEVESDLASYGYELLEVRNAPDRPGRELVFFAQRP